ncbi:hypothetical protein BJF96_g1706 [Verticillium dahliae]|uniref:Transcription factor domain-containing protein n=1 Tax=Verticillium dahliae TaxID=27337 RepID=A0AA44WPD2_VERDA|nr:hypothetical protein BJF96_g1706 [Verticillium dahliae]
MLPLLQAWDPPTQPRALGSKVLPAEEVEYYFDQYFKHFHPYFPIVRIRKPNRVYAACPILFWTIITVACRAYACDAELFSFLAQNLPREVWAVAMTPPLDLPAINALLVLSAWRFPSAKNSGDPSSSIASINGYPPPAGYFNEAASRVSGGQVVEAAVRLDGGDGDGDGGRTGPRFLVHAPYNVHRTVFDAVAVVFDALMSGFADGVEDPDAEVRAVLAVVRRCIVREEDLASWVLRLLETCWGVRHRLGALEAPVTECPRRVGALGAFGCVKRWRRRLDALRTERDAQIGQGGDDAPAVTAEDVAVGDLMQDVDWAMLMDVMDDFDWEGSAKAGGEPSLSMPG